ncbi:MAG TPA: hypothetical protein DCS66_21415 [Flavobacteriaceae bacterium]|nr:hypothetical protein [Flavobacteriaceae bacterium]|tara:strand:+ start:403 stop:594 length:192 start_codon:yes stop_codon:yes gene_type:complete
MPKNFLQKERQRIFRDLTKQYQEEGYYKREAKRMARRDTDDIMADKETFVDNFMQDTWGEIDE